MAKNDTVHILIKGRVQGVGFRYWLSGEAEARRLSGWVRNRRDGTVETVFAGDEAAVKDMLTACSLGPRFATVSNIELLEPGEPAGEGFEVRPTA